MKNQEVIDLWEAYNQIYESAAGGIVGTAPKSPVAKPAVRGIKKPVPVPAKVSENQEFEMWVNSLVEDGYDLSDYTWDDMYEMYVNAGENESDLFDYILEYLVAEGYADTNENALVIMANMSEEWREEIIEGVAARAAKVVDDQRQGYLGDADAINKNQDALSKSMGRLKRGQGPVVTPGLPGV